MGNEKQPAPQDLRERANEMFEDYMNREYGEAWEIVDATVIDALRDLWNYLKQPAPQDNFYCADWDRCGAICEEQCPACKKAEAMPDIPKPLPQDLRERIGKLFAENATSYMDSMGEYKTAVDAEGFYDAMLQFHSEVSAEKDKRIA